MTATFSANGTHAKGSRKQALERGDHKPPALTVNPEGIPPALRERARWVCWRYEQRADKAGNRKWTKVPIDPKSGRLAKTTDPATWGTIAQALDRYRADRLDGVGFVLGDGVAGVDLDDVLDPDTCTLAPWAAEVVRELDSYTEVSPSGTGVKVFLFGKVPAGGNRKGAVEVYDAGRYFAVTGAHLDGTPTGVNDRQAALASIHARYVATRKQSRAATGRTAAGNGTHTTASLTDEQVLTIAFGAKNGAKIRALYNGDMSGYDDNHSDADAALCCHFAWYTKDAAQLDRLFRGSKLFRPKWDEVHYSDGRTYGSGTIDGALETVTGQYQGPQPKRDHETGDKHAEGPATQPSAEGDRTGYGIILSHFRRKYQPTFRRGTYLYSAALGREVKMGEACCGAGKELIEQLAGAVDAPRNDSGVKRSALPWFFSAWARSAWVDLLDQLHNEEQADEIAGSAQDDFRARVAAALHTIVSMGQSYGRGREESVEVQRRTLADWCRLWAKLGHWERIRGYLLWSRKDRQPEGSDRLRIALRVGLFGQLGHGELTHMKQTMFTRLAAMYGVGTASEERPCGQRATELHPAFVAELMAGVDDLTVDDSSAHAHTCENTKGTSTEGQHA